MLQRTGVYVGAGYSDYLNIRSPGLGGRILALARTKGVDITDPSLVVPLLIAQAKAQAEHDARLMSGMACVIASAFGKPSMQEWLDTLVPPQEAQELKRARADRDAELRNRAMVAKIQMMAGRFDIQEVNNGR